MIPLNHHKIPAFYPIRSHNWCSSTVHSWDCRSPKTSKKHAKNIPFLKQISIIQWSDDKSSTGSNLPSADLLTKWWTVSGFTLDSLLSTAMRRPVGPRVSWTQMIFDDFRRFLLHVSARCLGKKPRKKWAKPPILLRMLVSSLVKNLSAPRCDSRSAKTKTWRRHWS